MPNHYDTLLHKHSFYEVCYVLDGIGHYIENECTYLLKSIRWGDPFAVIILVSLFLLAIVGIGLMIAALVKTPEQQMALGNLFVIATCMVSGMYWPIEIEPKLMQSVAEFLPQKWAMNGFTDIIANGAHISDVLGIYGILLAFAAVFFAVGVKALR
ncbi:ABC-type multidrug transport system permease subunit [Bacillus atrophaeus]|nr:ABC-type multidrug transport system permease subunit [Bacillus atrophaeus]